MTDNIVFGDLPPVARRKTREPKYADFAKAATEHTGQWALLGSDLPASTTKAINDGNWSEFSPAGEFQAVSRNSDAKGKADVWVRHVGSDATVTA